MNPDSVQTNRLVRTRSHCFLPLLWHTSTLVTGGDDIEGKGVRMTLSVSDLTGQLVKQTLRMSKNDFGLAINPQTEATQTQACHMNHLSYIHSTACGMPYSKPIGHYYPAVPGSPASYSSKMLYPTCLLYLSVSSHSSKYQISY